MYGITILLRYTKPFLFGIAFCIASSSWGQVPAELQQELLEMRELDQQGRAKAGDLEDRYGYQSAEWLAGWEGLNLIDRKNQQRLSEIVEQYGWPKISAVGARAALGAFLIVQHAEEGEIRLTSLGLLIDRILMREGKKTLYGTQLTRTPDSPDWFLWPIEDADRVDERRAEMGMVPLAEELTRYPFEVVPTPDDFEMRAAEYYASFRPELSERGRTIRGRSRGPAIFEYFALISI